MVRPFLLDFHSQFCLVFFFSTDSGGSKLIKMLSFLLQYSFIKRIAHLRHYSPLSFPLKPLSSFFHPSRQSVPKILRKRTKGSLTAPLPPQSMLLDCSWPSIVQRYANEYNSSQFNLTKYSFNIDFGGKGEFLAISPYSQYILELIVWNLSKIQYGGAKNR